MKHLSLALLLLAHGVLCCAWADPADTNAPSARRITLALLPLEDLSGNTNAAHWRTSFPSLVKEQLGAVKALRILPASTVQFGLGECGVKAGQHLTQERAQRLGRVMEARYVLWGSYSPKADGWRLRLQLLHTATGQTSPKWTVVSTNWFASSLKVSQKVLQHLGVTPTRQEKDHMRHPPSKSPEALEILLRSHDEFHEGKTMPAVEADLRRAIALDPQSAKAWCILGSAIALQGRFDDAVLPAKRAVALAPENGRNHFLLGYIYEHQELLHLAEEQYATAMRLDPDDAETYLGLGEISYFRHHLEEAVALFQAAGQLAPYEANIRAELGRAYATQGQDRAAKRELKAAERYAGKNPMVEQMIGAGYSVLNSTPEELEHFEKYLAYVEARGMHDEALREHVAGLKAKLAPQFVHALAPRAYTEPELHTALQARLSTQELLLVTNPLACSPDMKRWAQRLVAKAEGEQEKARRLFAGLTRPVSLEEGENRKRTAQETFQALQQWREAPGFFTCQEYTFLYLALARAVGLNACFTEVKRDYQDKPVSHACACVFLANGQALLVDPAYAWFGVPHQDFAPADDLHVIGYYLAQVPDLAQNQLAVKLIPDAPLAHFNLALKLDEAGRVKEGRAALEAGLKVDSKSWLALYAQGATEAYEGKLEEAVAHFRQSLVDNAELPKTHYLLGRALLAQRKLPEAREEFRLALQGKLPPALTDEALDALAKTNELLAEAQTH